MDSWVRSLDDRKSTFGYVFHMNSSVISWSSKKKPIVSQPTPEVEYIVGNVVACQVIFLRRVLTDLKEH